MCFKKIGLPVNLEKVELVGTHIMVGTEDKPSTVYRFRIMRYATWDYVMQLKATNPSLGFFKYREANARDVLCAVYHQIDDQKIVIRPVDRNEVIYIFMVLRLKCFSDF